MTESTQCVQFAIPKLHLAGGGEALLKEFDGSARFTHLLTVVTEFHEAFTLAYAMTDFPKDGEALFVEFDSVETISQTAMLPT